MTNKKVHQKALKKRRLAVTFTSLKGTKRAAIDVEAVPMGHPHMGIPPPHDPPPVEGGGVEGPSVAPPVDAIVQRDLTSAIVYCDDYCLQRLLQFRRGGLKRVIRLVRLILPESQSFRVKRFPTELNFPSKPVEIA